MKILSTVILLLAKGGIAMAKGKQYDVAKEKIKVLKMEVDYHLLTLHDAMRNGDIVTENQERNTLITLRGKLEDLGAFAK